VTPGVSSGVAPIFVEPSGQNRIWVVKGANDRLTPADVDAAEEVIRGADFLVLQLEIPVGDGVYYALRFARGLGVRTILNPAPGQTLDLARIADADYVIPNETEAEALTGMVEPRSAAQSLIDGGLRRVIVTLGANGALCADDDGMRMVPPFPVDCRRYPYPHGRGRRIHRKPRRVSRRRPRGERRGLTREPVRRALHHVARNAEIVRHPRALRKRVGDQGCIKTLSALRSAQRSNALRHSVIGSLTEIRSLRRMRPMRVNPHHVFPGARGVADRPAERELLIENLIDGKIDFAPANGDLRVAAERAQCFEAAANARGMAGAFQRHVDAGAARDFRERRRRGWCRQC